MTVRDLVIVGMRRTGTTILFDSFVRDARFTTLYEPLNRVQDEPLLGGGSGVHQVDLYHALRPLRHAFLRDHPDIAADDLNYGGPTRADAEIDPFLPDHVQAYIQHIMDGAGPKVAKFVRLPAKLELLRTLVPECALVWTVRDPRAVARSYLFGRNGKFADTYPDADAWFTRTTNLNRWSIGVLSDTILQAGAHATVSEPTDLERVLIVWKHMVQAMESGAEQGFGSQAMMLRHEDFCRSPALTMQQIGERMGVEASQETCSWLDETVSEPATPPHESDDRWASAFARLGMQSLVTRLGY